jgi:hypothetical protein
MTIPKGFTLSENTLSLRGIEILSENHSSLERSYFTLSHGAPPPTALSNGTDQGQKRVRKNKDRVKRSALSRLSLF